MAETKVPLGTYAHHTRHWHYVKKQRAVKKTHTMRELFMGQTVSVLGTILTGYLLELSKNELLVFAGAILVLPGVFDLGGSVAGAMGARIAHRLDSGAPARKVIRDSLLHAFYLCISAGVLLGLFGGLIASLFANGDLVKVAMLVSLACITSGVIGFPLIAWFTYFSHKKGLDPDNVVGPVETTMFDLLSLVTMALIIKVVL